jgi:hypothetical protein
MVPQIGPDAWAVDDVSFPKVIKKTRDAYAASKVT